eukprot:s10_g13.t1
MSQLTSAAVQGQMGGRQPSQICFGPGGELVVAFRTGYVQLLGPDDYSQKGPQLRPPSDAFHPSGLAVLGDRVFVSCSRTSTLHQFSLRDGSHLQQRKGGSHWELQEPSGMAVIEDRILAIADRGLHRVLLLDAESLDFHGQVPDHQTWRSKEAPGALRKPNDVAVDAAGNLLVMDTQNERAPILPASSGEQDKGNTFSYLSCNHETGYIAISNNDEHRVAVLIAACQQVKITVAESTGSSTFIFQAVQLAQQAAPASRTETGMWVEVVSSHPLMNNEQL